MGQPTGGTTCRRPLSSASSAAAEARRRTRCLAIDVSAGAGQPSRPACDVTRRASSAAAFASGLLRGRLLRRGLPGAFFARGLAAARASSARPSSAAAFFVRRLLRRGFLRGAAAVFAGRLLHRAADGFLRGGLLRSRPSSPPAWRPLTRPSSAPPSGSGLLRRRLLRGGSHRQRHGARAGRRSLRWSPGGTPSLRWWRTPATRTAAAAAGSATCERRVAGRRRTGHAPPGSTTTSRRTAPRRRRDRTARRRVAIARAIATADVDALPSRGGGPSVQAASVQAPCASMSPARGWRVSRPALLRVRLRSARTRLRPIDRTFPVACTCRSLDDRTRESVKRCADSAIRVSPAHVNKKRPLLAAIAQKNAPRHRCRGACIASQPRAASLTRRRARRRVSAWRAARRARAPGPV